MADAGGTTTLDGLVLACPECRQPVPIPIQVTVSYEPDGELQHLTLDPDFTDLWAHTWVHTHPEG